MNREVTVQYEEIELELQGYFDPGSDTVFYYSDMSGHPGDPPEFSVEAVLHEGKDIINIIDDTILEQLESKALDILL